jgi:hypothetical protein
MFAPRVVVITILQTVPRILRWPSEFGFAGYILTLEARAADHGSQLPDYWVEVALRIEPV